VVAPLQNKVISSELKKTLSATSSHNILKSNSGKTLEVNKRDKVHISVTDLNEESREYADVFDRQRGSTKPARDDHSDMIFKAINQPQTQLPSGQKNNHQNYKSHQFLNPSFNQMRPLSKQGRSKRPLTAHNPNNKAVKKRFYSAKNPIN
jgi:hypothetical protein